MNWAADDVKVHLERLEPAGYRVTFENEVKTPVASWLRRLLGFRWLGFFSLLALLLLTHFSIPFTGRDWAPGVAASAAAVPVSLYLPAVTTQQPEPFFGFHMRSGSDRQAWLERAIQSGAGWVRSERVEWSQVEAREGSYDWSRISWREAEWINAAERNMLTIASVGSTPVWAQAIPGAACGPIKAEKLDAFASFVRALVERYSIAPYNLLYWEIWNEPDIVPEAVTPDSPFGCWGDADDAYYGGVRYGQMLQVVYPAIKAANPHVQVLAGGLALDCDPVTPPPGKGDCRPARFLEGVLESGAGPYFDGVGIHSYDTYYGALGLYASPNWHTAWDNHDGAILSMEAKLRYVQGLLDRYGVTGKFVMNNETGVGLYAAATNDTYEKTKAYYLAQNFATAIALGLKANIWYSLDHDWRHQALLNEDATPRPAYAAFQFAAESWRGARFQAALSDYPGVKGYAFTRPGDRLWILWSIDGQVHNVTLPDRPQAVYDVDGTALAVTGQRLNVGLEPLYLLWRP